MKYHNRLLEQKLEAYYKAFPCVLLAGARQVGKSTLIKHLFRKQAKIFTFDPTQDLYGERSDPDLFLRNNPPPIILDEIQYVPELVPVLKRYVDEHRAPGLFLITGSQQWQVMRKLSESLAGRIAMLELPAFSLSEQLEDTGLCWFSTWLSEAVSNPERANAHLLEFSSSGLSPMQLIWRGFYPEVHTLREDVITGWMRGYVNTYLQRDIRSLLAIRNETQFASFLSLCAALTAQECNYSQIGRDIGLSTPAAQNWLGVLKGTFQWLEIPAFSTNQIKKLSQKPKGYLTDTGLACYFLRLSSPDALLGHPLFGALFESFVVLELFKQVQALRLVPAFYHFRQHSGAEVDLVLDMDGKLFPIEIKATSRIKPPDASAVTGFQEKMGKVSGPGLIVYAGREVLKLTETCIAVPFDAKIRSGDE